MTRIGREYCIFCKSTSHNYRNCPLAFRVRRKTLAKTEYFGEAPNVFIGHYGYPHVTVGFLNVEEYTEQDEPLKWSAEGKSIPEIIDLRTQLVNSTFPQHVKGSSRLLTIGQEVGMAKKPAELELKVRKKPVFTLTFNGEAQPHGPRVPLTTARLTSNVTTDTRVERVVDDTDLKSAPALVTLYKKGFDEHFLRKLFSTGNLGVKTERKLVPTRWSITAVDDTLGKALISEIQKFPESDCQLYLGGYLGNEYAILLLDDVWSYELFEGYVPRVQKGGAWETDYEPYSGRKAYASETAGGYYAARLAILEKLKKQQRQAAVLALRFVTEEYSAPLGVWVVREAVRKAMAARPLVFGDRQLLLQYVTRYAQRRFGIDLQPLLKQSRLLKHLTTQTRLNRAWPGTRRPHAHQ